MSKALRAVLVEDDAKRAPGFREGWNSILENVFPDVDIRVITDIAATEDILQGRPHILLLDNAFPENGREVSNKGVDFIVGLKSKFPDTLFVLFTGNSFHVDTLGYKFPNPDLVVPKTPLSSGDYQKYLAGEIRNKLKRIPIPEVVIVDPKESAAADRFRDELHSIVEQCLFKFQDVPGKDFIRRVNLSKLGGGYSGSNVFLAEIYGVERYSNLPLVLKLSEGSSASAEVRRYNMFARLQMPHDMRVDLIGSGDTTGFSGALYAFALGKIGKLSSATDEIAKGDFRFLDLVKNKLFLSERIGWYKDIKLEDGVEKFYNNSQEYLPAKDSKRIEQFRENMEEIFGASNVVVDIDNYAVPNVSTKHVRRFLRDFSDVSLPKTICHGDFNSNNIIINSSTSSLSTIDFEYTGYDVFYKDFVSLECSIRAYWSVHAFATPKDHLQLFAAETELLAGKPASSATKAIPRTLEYFQALSIVRTIAKETIEKTGHAFDMRSYVLALAFHLLKLNGLNIWNRSSKIKLAAALFASGKYLEDVAGNP